MIMANKRNADNPITEEQAKTQKENGAKSIITKKPRQPEVLDQLAEKYHLKALMNVRKKPSTEASILDTRAEGTIVRVPAMNKTGSAWRMAPSSSTRMASGQRRYKQFLPKIFVYYIIL